MIITIMKFWISPSPPLGAKTFLYKKKADKEIAYDTFNAKEIRQLTSFVNF